jgi:hypothetical protein
MGVISKTEFIRRYSTSLLEENAALFAGAGLSIPAGFADWRKLLKEIAEDLQLDIERENDLVALAQYEANRKGNRDSLVEAIIRQFDREARLTENHRLIARLPIETIWTTNYDKLLERAIQEANKRPDIKITVPQLTLRKPYCDVVVFKMHGDVDFASNAILTKDDYECYESQHGAFTVQLLADLLSKRFLFLGFSFTDPNIDYTFNRLRRLLNPSSPSKGEGKEHYCVLRKPQADDYKHLPIPTEQQTKSFQIDAARFEHRIADMSRFGIQTVIIEHYHEITELLAALLRRVSTRSVFISGAADDYSPLGKDRIESLSEDLGRRLIEEGYDILSGVGKGIGAAVMIGAHSALGRPEASRLGQRLKLFPFPYWHSTETERNEYYAANRKEMAAQAGASIFIAGNKLQGSVLVESPGVFAEFEEAKKNKHFIIPIGASGHAAKRIWDEVRADPPSYFGVVDVSQELNILGDSTSTNENIIEAVLSALNKVRQTII